ncbi:DUF305 domain-containing protein [Paeniglutamicibacter kerguelensis]|uniref:Uncharacterized protein (DUF305 family) n=1 Tax=Paeniglutamicibacter kerguelensis TaxID=254788 RepID=A0ABS4X7X9_9MICC|nr:DUF305 domain-containing protein [Paeniglutamicibacter kerguelensis]MBP2384568.1 uncharacterized protein (DUF305 family) [Paeniglutamicibacter kerguelensis]
MKKNTTTLMLSAPLVAGALILAGCSAPAPVPGGNTTTSQHAAGHEHNGADTTFAQMMIPHHEQAVLMSETMLKKNNLHTETVKLVTDIKNAQAPEIKLMESWLEGWGEPREMGHPMAMESMLGEEDLQALTNAQGRAAEELFLNQMIGHHLGATKMAKDALKNGKDPRVLELGRKIIADQNAEIAHMRDMLKK